MRSKHLIFVIECFIVQCVKAIRRTAIIEIKFLKSMLYVSSCKTRTHFLGIDQTRRCIWAWVCSSILPAMLILGVEASVAADDVVLPPFLTGSSHVNLD